MNSGQTQGPTQTTTKQSLSIVLGLLLLAILAGGLIALSIWLWKSIEGANSAVVAAAVTASATVLVSTAGLLFGRYSERKLEYERRRQEKRIPVYEGFVDFWFTRVLYGTKTGKPPVTERELHEFFAAFTRDLMIWGSDEVIEKWAYLRNQWAQLGEKPTQSDSTLAMLEFEQLLLAIRRDIGYPDTELPPRSILGLFINDIETLPVPPRK